ncbi:MAG: PA2169 family four-helix-bundle protein [Trueperaceae bacterium]|nr:PA2169 family four-helix-bundle protein [Trueperaceae bacterium]
MSDQTGQTDTTETEQAQKTEAEQADTQQTDTQQADTTKTEQTEETGGEPATAEDNRDLIEALNTLIRTCIDGEIGYQEAAEEADHDSYRALFEQYAKERARFASELQGEVKGLGGTPETSGSTSGALHRAWLNVRDAVTGKGDADIIAECLRGETVALEAYDEALEGDLPGSIERTVERQRARIAEVARRLETLDDAA